MQNTHENCVAVAKKLVKHGQGDIEDRIKTLVSIFERSDRHFQQVVKNHGFDEEE